MNRHQQFFVNDVKTIKACDNEMVYFEGSAFEKQFEIKYFKEDKHNLDNCEGCKNAYKTILQQTEAYYKTFPLCCDLHKNLIKESWFDKRDFKDLPKMVADKVLFTHHHIINKLDTDNWKEELTNYIEYGITSFGQIPNGYGEPIALSKYLGYIVELQEGFKLEGENRKYKDRQQYIINFIKNYSKPPKEVKTDLNLLLSTYDKWYRMFPFEIPLFKGLKNHFSKALPLLSERPKVNPYLGTAKVKLLTQDRLFEYLMSITSQILATIDTTQLLQEEYITDATKYQFDIKKKAHKLNQEVLLKEFSKGEKRYIKTIKKWLENEKNFLKDIQLNIVKLPIGINTKKTSKTNSSFTYKKLKFESANLTDLRDALKRHKLIAEDTGLSVFKKVFSGDDIDKPIVWTGNISELYYFISQLHNKLKYVEDLKQQQWEVTNICFIKTDGSQFGRHKFKGQKRPTTFKNIDLSLKTLQ